MPALARGAAKVEGEQPGSKIQPQHFNRHIKCYQITEHELDTITLVNAGISLSATIGSFLMAFWLDIFKDTLLAESIPEASAEAVSYVLPICFVLGLLFWGGAIALFIWRRGFISDIKASSVDANLVDADGGQTL